ncbi:hypothetical protein ACFLV3_02105 [Chloroflexota bacterium]
MFKKFRGIGGQQGETLILVLIALAVGSLVIVPTLSYVNTGLTASRIHQDALLDQYTADAAIEYILWELKYDVDDINDQINPENPSYDDTININGTEVPINIEITQSSLGNDWPFPVPPSQQGVYLDAAIVIGGPYLSGDGQLIYFPHKVYMYNSGTSQTHVKAILQELDPSFDYVEDSFSGYDNNLTKTYVDDHWELYFDLASPLPSLDPGEATFVSFLASTTGDIEEVSQNTYVGSGWVEYAAFEAEEGAIFEGEYLVSNFGKYYDITSTIGQYTIIVNVGITEEGEIVIRSYTIQ